MAENLSISEKLSDIQTTKTAIREAIVAKGVDMPDGTTFRQYSNKIDDIIGVPALSNPGAADDLRSGKQLVGADGSIVTGNLPEVIQATPTISVSSGGLITASATQSGGIVEAGSKGSTQQLTTQGAKTVTPTTTNQTAVASGRYTTGDVKVAGDANLVPENIAEGVSIFGVTGAHSGGGGVGEWVTIPLSESLSRAGGTTQTVYGTLSVSQVPFVVYFLMCETDGGSPYASDTVIVSEITENSAGLINNNATDGRFGISQLDIANNLWSITFYIDPNFGTYSSEKCYALVIYNPTI